MVEKNWNKRHSLNYTWRALFVAIKKISFVSLVQESVVLMAINT